MKGQINHYHPKWKRMLIDIRFHFVMFIILLVILIVGQQIIRIALLKNAQATGIALSRNYAAEERSKLDAYETLLSFARASIDESGNAGRTRQELDNWLKVYFESLNVVLGEKIIDPYVVYDGQLLEAYPWEGMDDYDPIRTQWYEKAIAAGGSVIFTDVYIDAVFDKPVITLAQKCENSDTVVAFDISLDKLDFQFESLPLTKGNSFFLCDSKGAVIYQRTELQKSEEVRQQYLNDLIGQINVGKQEHYSDSVIDPDGNKCAVYYTRMKNGWFSIVTVPYFNIMGELKEFYVIFLSVMTIFLLVLLWISWRELKARRRMERAYDTVQVLGNSYYALYRINYAKNMYEMIKGSAYVRSRIPQKGNYERLLKVLEEIIEPEAYREYLKSFSRENIRKLVSQKVHDYGGDFLRKFDDEYRWVNVRILFDEDMTPGEAVLCFREVEEEKQRQLEEMKLMEESLKLARQNEQAKQDFFSNMSHDMRTPLNAIIGLSDLAQQHIQEPEKTADYLDKIQTSSHQLLELINDILDMSRMEQGRVMLNNQQFDLRKCLEESLAAFRYQAEREDKKFRVELNLNHAILVGDPFRINQILNNLLSNAFKFTQEGDKISLSVSQIGRGDYPKYKFVISDTGSGMSREFLNHLFEPYTREIRFGEKQTTGTGLGMSITKNLVTQMNGKIHVRSEQGEGTEFTVILPFTAVGAEAGLAKQSGPVPDSKPSGENGSAKQSGSVPDSQASWDGMGEPGPGELQEALRGKHILLAEDNEINMEIATELLAMYGAEVTQAWNGVEAVQCFRKTEPFYFDAILMDMQMPEMDGCEAARLIRSTPREDASVIPVIAVTANAFAEDIMKTTVAGMNAHISKPIDFTMLCRTLEKIWSERRI